MIEYAGAAMRALSMEGRMTLCNMSIEAGARAGMVAPDDTTCQWLAGRPFAPRGAAWDAALARWRRLPSDDGAVFDRELSIAGSGIAPMVTWGTSPEDVLPITGRVPDPAAAIDAERRAGNGARARLHGAGAGQPLTDLPVDRVFIGSCTNGRIEDLRSAAAVVRGRRVAAGVRRGSSRDRAW